MKIQKLIMKQNKTVRGNFY